MRILFTLLLIFILSCCVPDAETGNYPYSGGEKPKSELIFDKAKWNVKEGREYKYRDKMVNDVVYNDTIRQLNKDQILELLGKPDRQTDYHLYYTVKQKRIGNWPLHTKSIAVKLTDQNKIEWIKIHE